MKKTILLFLITVAIACSDSTDVFEDNFTRGGLIVFAPKPESTRINTLNLDTYELSVGLEDPNNNATLYELDLIYGATTVDNFRVITSFPNTLTFTGQDLLDAIGITANEIDVTVPLEFVATITTDDGNIYNGLLSDFNFDTNEQDGGDSGNLLLDNPAFNQAIVFNFTFFIPPPKKLRGTSFEEPFAAGAGSDYTRPSAEADLTAELMNNPGERHVMYVATGTGEDDEIGFTTNFVSTGDGGFTTEEIGVTNNLAEVGEYLDGSQGYQLEDIDGQLIISFDRVEIPAEFLSSGVQIQFFPRDTGWESDDTLIIKALVEYRDGTSETIIMTDINGDNIDDEGLEGQWNLSDTGFINNVLAITLTIEAIVDSGNEDIYFDQMLVFIPE